MIVALTGSLEAEGGASLTRTGFREAVEAVGGQYATSLTAEVEVLVVGSGAMASKVERAQSLGIDVVPWASFRSRLEHHAPPPTEAEVPLAAPSENAPPSIETTEHLVRITDVQLERSSREHPLVPNLAPTYVLDATTLRLLRSVALAVQLRQPMLLEGGTGTSKTSAILQLAALLGQPVARLNLNGQTDTSELIGRYVPSEQGWRWSEGAVVTAMREGHWLILDEVNLAEPSVLERLNPVLERTPTLLVSEGDGARLGPGGAPVHADFRVFATMNPSDYEGRSVLSEAWRDRFAATVRAMPPTEADARHLLDYAITGNHPDVTVAGSLWSGSTQRPTHSSLASHLKALNPRIAAFHVGLRTLTMPGKGRAPSIGAGTRERQPVTRRSLLAVLDSLRDLTLYDPRVGSMNLTSHPDRIVRETLERVYLDRIRTPDDRAKVVALLDSLDLPHD